MRVALGTPPREQTAHADRTLGDLRIPRPEPTTPVGRTQDGQVTQHLEPTLRAEVMPPGTRPAVATPMPPGTRAEEATPMRPRQLPGQMQVGQRQQDDAAHRQQLARSPAGLERKYRRAIEAGTFVRFKPTT